MATNLVLQLTHVPAFFFFSVSFPTDLYHIVKADRQGEKIITLLQDLKWCVPSTLKAGSRRSFSVHQSCPVACDVWGNLMRKVACIIKTSK